MYPCFVLKYLLDGLNIKDIPFDIDNKFDEYDYEKSEESKKGIAGMSSATETTSSATKISCAKMSAKIVFCESVVCFKNIFCKKGILEKCSVLS